MESMEMMMQAIQQSVGSPRKGMLGGAGSDAFAQLLAALSATPMEGGMDESLMALLAGQDLEEQQEANVNGGMLSAQELFASFMFLQDAVAGEGEALQQTVVLEGGQAKLLESAPTQQASQTVTQAAAEVVTLVSGQSEAPHADADSGELLNGQGKFGVAVAAAQKLLSENKKSAEESDTPLDVDALQQTVNQARSFQQNNVAQAQAKDVQHAALPEQVHTGVAQGLAEGKKDFVIRLKPDGLGELTIHLTEEDGTTTLSILTSSVQAARLLDAEAGALRESLRPLGIQVREIAPQPEQSAQTAAGAQAFAQMQQGQQQRSFMERWFMPTASSGNENAREELAEQEPIPLPTLRAAGLNAYI